MRSSGPAGRISTRRARPLQSSNLMRGLGVNPPRKRAVGRAGRNSNDGLEHAAGQGVEPDRDAGLAQAGEFDVCGHLPFSSGSKAHRPATRVGCRSRLSRRRTTSRRERIIARDLPVDVPDGKVHPRRDYSITEPVGDELTALRLAAKDEFIPFGCVSRVTPCRRLTGRRKYGRWS